MNAPNKRLQYAFVSYMSVGRDHSDWVGDGIIRYAPLEHAETFIERNLIFGMTERMADFIRSNCKCVFCSKPVSFNLEICDCGEQDSHIAEVSYPLQSLHQTVMLLAETEATDDWLLRKQTYRKNRLQTNGGKHSAADIAKLFSLQRGQCYYCGATLTDANGKKIYHIDHFISLTKLGTNDLKNLVLACPPCNLEKGTIDGKTFVKQAILRLDEVSLAKAADAQSQIVMYKKKLKTALAHKTSKTNKG